MTDEGGGRRFCASCTERVHDLSELTQAQAEKLLAEKENAASFCIRYTSFEDTGEVAFREPSVQAASRFTGWRGMAAGFAAAAAVTGCADPSPTPTSVGDTHCTYERGPLEFKMARGEGDCPPVDKPPRVEVVDIVQAPPSTVAEPEIVEPEPPVEPCEPDVDEERKEDIRRSKVKKKGGLRKRTKKGKRRRPPTVGKMKKRQGKKVSFDDDEFGRL